MTQKRKVGPGGGDFALNPNRFGGGGGGRSGASVVKKARKKTAKPETSMKTKRKSTRTRGQMDRLEAKLERAQYKKTLEHSDSGYRYKNREDLKKGPDGRVRINIEGKGGLRKEVKDFRRTLDKQDKADTNAVKAYSALKKSKHNLDRGKPITEIGTKATLDWERRRVKDLAKSLRSAQKENLAINFKSALDFGRNPKDPTVRKVIRHNKKTVKEQFKKQIKKDRVKRKLDESKKRERASYWNTKDETIKAINKRLRRRRN
jgi:hypothetical protein